MRKAKRTVTLKELAADPQLQKDFLRAAFATSAPAGINSDNCGVLRPSTWDEPFDYFASDHGWPRVDKREPGK